MSPYTRVMAGKNDWSTPDQTDGDVAVAEEVKVKRPKMYKVLVHNDDYTTMEFVVMVLRVVFFLDEAQSTSVMLHVHRNGSGVAGVYTFELAETRIRKATDLARQNDYPLKFSMEPV